MYVANYKDTPLVLPIVQPNWANRFMTNRQWVCLYLYLRIVAYLLPASVETTKSSASDAPPSPNSSFHNLTVTYHYVQSPITCKSVLFYEYLF